jgi:hypothetical protein
VVAGEVGHHLDAVAAEVRGEPPVGVGGQHRRVGRPAEQRDGRLQAGGEGEAVQLVELVAAEWLAGHLGDLGAGAVPAVVHVTAAGRLAGDRPQLDALGGDQCPEHLADLAADGGAHDHLRAQLDDHAGLPDALAPGVYMDLHRVGRLLDRHGELRRRGKYQDVVVHIP